MRPQRCFQCILARRTGFDPQWSATESPNPSTMMCRPCPRTPVGDLSGLNTRLELVTGLVGSAVAQQIESPPEEIERRDRRYHARPYAPAAARVGTHHHCDESRGFESLDGCQRVGGRLSKVLSGTASL